MPKYAVHTVIRQLQIIDADTPEAAARAVAAYVERVTAVAADPNDYADLPELRAPMRCTACGRPQPAGSIEVCGSCLYTTPTT